MFGEKCRCDLKKSLVRIIELQQSASIHPVTRVRSPYHLSVHTRRNESGSNEPTESSEHETHS